MQSLSSHWRTPPVYLKRKNVLNAICHICNKIWQLLCYKRYWFGSSQTWESRAKRRGQWGDRLSDTVCFSSSPPLCVCEWSLIYFINISRWAVQGDFRTSLTESYFYRKLIKTFASANPRWFGMAQCVSINVKSWSVNKVFSARCRVRSLKSDSEKMSDFCFWWTFCL